tara:strand:- start:16883 stop:17080 length:198 start_codon:yes stop_codon:yes gene_type:complete
MFLTNRITSKSTKEFVFRQSRSGKLRQFIGALVFRIFETLQWLGLNRRVVPNTMSNYANGLLTGR